VVLAEADDVSLSPGQARVRRVSVTGARHAASRKSTWFSNHNPEKYYSQIYLQLPRAPCPFRPVITPERGQ